MQQSQSDMADPRLPADPASTGLSAPGTSLAHGSKVSAQGQIWHARSRAMHWIWPWTTPHEVWGVWMRWGTPHRSENWAVGERGWWKGAVAVAMLIVMAPRSVVINTTTALSLSLLHQISIPVTSPFPHVMHPPIFPTWFWGKISGSQENSLYGNFFQIEP